MLFLNLLIFSTQNIKNLGYIKELLIQSIKLKAEN